MTNTTEGFRVHPVYKTVEIRHPKYPEDAQPLTVEIRQNLTNNQIDNLPKILAGSTATMKDLRDGIAPYVKSWNFQAEDANGVYAPVPAPMDAGGDVFQLMDDFFTFEIYWHVRYAAYGGRPESQEAEDRKNSSAASDNSPSAPDAATHATNTPTPIRGSSTDSTRKTSTAKSPKRKTTSSPVA